jgi:hypothetical protein
MVFGTFAVVGASYVLTRMLGGGETVVFRKQYNHTEVELWRARFAELLDRWQSRGAVSGAVSDEDVSEIHSWIVLANMNLHEDALEFSFLGADQSVREARAKKLRELQSRGEIPLAYIISWSRSEDDLRQGLAWILTAHLDGGHASFTLYPSYAIDVEGGFGFSGAAQFVTDSRLTVSGGMKFSGQAQMRRGEELVCQGQLPIGGSAALKSGRAVQMAGAIPFGGGAAFNRGVLAIFGGTVPIRGGAVFSSVAPVSLAATGGLPFSGGALFDQQAANDDWIDAVYVLHEEKSVVVYG